VNNRLEVTVFGTQYSIGLLHMSRNLIKAGMETYGPKRWSKLISEIACNNNSNKLISDVCHTIGHTIKIVYRSTGIAMHHSGFGMEVFHDGKFFPVNAVGAKSQTLHPSKLMKDYKKNDMLGVFWAKRESSMLFRWDDVNSLKQEEIILVYDSLAPVLARKKPFELTLDVMWKGQKGHQIESARSSDFEPQKHIFHRIR